MGIIKNTGYVPGYGYIDGKNFVRNMTSIPEVKEKYTTANEKRIEVEIVK